mmetsp:Transcript_18020/g.43295  ORF Transcript_18020/g.43295 Transcript_18020/m.43295 type:complete len:304 (-) Transcript_18020:1637-2548(-)
MRKSTRVAKQAAKARLSGAISSDSPQNKKIVFGNNDAGDSFDDDIQIKNDDNEEGENDGRPGRGNIGKDDNDKSESDGDDDDDAVEEVKGGAARELTQRLRDAERKVAKESIPKKKRKKTNDDAIHKADAENNESCESESDDEEEEDLLTDDFFKMVDTERKDQLQRAKQEKKQQKLQQKKRMGKHTTFVVEDEYKTSDTPYKMNQNIEVIALGGGKSTAESTNNLDDEHQLLISAKLGSAPSKAAMAFARGSMPRGVSKERSSNSRKRKSKDEETWKRSRKLNRLGVGSRPGQAAALFVRKK